MAKIPVIVWGLALSAAASQHCHAQQAPDDDFHFSNAEPAFDAGAGPSVCIDEAHFNFHTADGRYRPFADLLRADGFVVDGYDGELTAEALAECMLLVIANPLAEENQSDWSYPHPSAFTRAEMRGLKEWVQGGGRLLLFADHAPIAGAARDLGAVFGVAMLDVYADGGPGPDVFDASSGTLRDHPIVVGRNRGERVDAVMTFTGQAFQLTEGWHALLVFGPNAVARINAQQAFAPDGDQWPGFSIAGWAHGAAREWDDGRVVFLGEAAMCSAQVGGPNRRPMGMNDPRAEQNPQFCLNVVRWLTGVLDD